MPAPFRQQCPPDEQLAKELDEKAQNLPDNLKNYMHVLGFTLLPPLALAASSKEIARENRKQKRYRQHREGETSLNVLWFAKFEQPSW